LKLDSAHLAYCTNIHAAETWAQTREVLESHVLTVRDRLRTDGSLAPEAPFAIGLRLSAMAATELLTGANLPDFKQWLESTQTYVFTINGFPFGSFHGTRVKEQVFMPDWTDRARLNYTKDLFKILSTIAPPGSAASVSTLPGSLKAFHADESLIFYHLIELAEWLEILAQQTGHDFHLGLEPEPLGHFENTAETLAFFERLSGQALDPSILQRRIGVNYDACHFALQYESAGKSLEALAHAGIRISKIHLSSAIALDPCDPAALAALRAFEEPTYFHQVLLQGRGREITRYYDLPEFFSARDAGALDLTEFMEMRVHFHIPLDAEPAAPLRSTRSHAQEILVWRRSQPDACHHYEIETYTWSVLPAELQRPVADQLAGEYRWVIENA